MRAKEFILEDDYWGDRDYDNAGRTEDELQQFLDGYVEEHLGAPHKASARRDMGVVVAIPRKNPNTGQQVNLKYEGWREEWVQTADDLIDELRRNDFGDYQLDTISPAHIELARSNINETTSAGGIATVVGGIGNMLYRNPSIYSNTAKYTKPAKKKKKKTADNQNKENT